MNWNEQIVSDKNILLGKPTIKGTRISVEFILERLANENFPGPGVAFLRENNIDIVTIAEQHSGITDKQVMEFAINEKRTILTHDSDYGELIFKFGYKPKEGVVYFRIYDFEPIDPGKILLELIHQDINFTSCLTVVNENAIRQRSYLKRA